MKTANLLVSARYYINPAVTDPDRLAAAIRARFPRAAISIRTYDPDLSAFKQVVEETIATSPESHLYAAHEKRVETELRAAFAEAAI